MTVGSSLKERLTLAGYKICSSCREVLTRMDTKGVQWVEEHCSQLSRMVHANLRRDTGRVPYNIRRRWIERQIRLAIKQERKTQKA